MIRVNSPRTIVTTDPELDDLNSMLRLLLYSNEIPICGLIYTSSRYHYAGLLERGIAPHRWPAERAMHIDVAVNAYEKVYRNLVRHDPRYPEPGLLRSLIRWGNVTAEDDMSADTPGSELIADVLLDAVPGRVFLQAWGGLNTIARALATIESRWSGSAWWPALHARISAKAVITSFGQQDNTYRTYIAAAWPQIEFRDVATQAWGYEARGAVVGKDAVYLSAEWMHDNVSTVGPLGAEYRVWGDSKQMAAGFDDSDYFGAQEKDPKALRARGYTVWTLPQQTGSWISEGDSSNFALLIDNGLRSWQDARWGGWGGRQERVAAGTLQFRRCSRSYVERLSEPRERCERRLGHRALVPCNPERFRGALALVRHARIRGCNHPPVVTGSADRAVQPGETVLLQARAADPGGETVAVRVPHNAQPGQTIHIITEVTDSRVPPLTRYHRTVLYVAWKGARLREGRTQLRKPHLPARARTLRKSRLLPHT